MPSNNESASRGQWTTTQLTVTVRVVPVESEEQTLVGRSAVVIETYNPDRITSPALQTITPDLVQS